MLKKKNTVWKVGLMAILALASLISAIFFIGSQKSLFGSVFHLETVFNNVAGLKVGSNVRFGGITVGTVSDIQMITDSSVKVGMIIQSSFKHFIKKDATVGIGSDGIMGDKVLSISPGSYNQQEIKDGDRLTSQKPIEIDAIIASLKLSVDHIAIFTDQLSKITYRINHSNGVFSKLIGDTLFANNITNTMSNLKKSSINLNENMEAAKHNFLLRGYFKKKKKDQEKKLKLLNKETDANSKN